MDLAILMPSVVVKKITFTWALGVIFSGKMALAVESQTVVVDVTNILTFFLEASNTSISDSVPLTGSAQETVLTSPPKIVFDDAVIGKANTAEEVLIKTTRPNNKHKISTALLIFAFLNLITKALSLNAQRLNSH